MATGLIPRPLREILTGTLDILNRNYKYNKYFSGECVARRVCLIATAALGAYAFYRVNPSGPAKMAAAAFGACVLSLPSTVLAAAGYLFYNAATSGIAAYAEPSVKAAAIFAGYLISGYIVSEKHDLAPFGILDRFVFTPIARAAGSAAAPKIPPK